MVEADLRRARRLLLRQLFSLIIQVRQDSIGLEIVPLVITIRNQTRDKSANVHDAGRLPHTPTVNVVSPSARAAIF